MSGDWIKMRSNLWDDPRVSRVCDLTDQTEAAIVGGLYWLWATADQHTEDGVLPSLTLRQIDRKTGVQGLGDALCKVGWLVDDPLGVIVPRFSEHNGASAKRRCADAQRKAGVRSVSASCADKTRTSVGQVKDEMRQGAELEIEKRREEKKEHVAFAPVGFSEFWKAWPPSERKGSKAKCADMWAKSGFEADTKQILGHVEAMKSSDGWRKDAGKFIPAPLVYLNGKRWDGAEVVRLVESNFAGAI